MFPALLSSAKKKEKEMGQVCGVLLPPPLWLTSSSIPICPYFSFHCILPYLVLSHVGYLSLRPGFGIWWKGSQIYDDTVSEFLVLWPQHIFRSPVIGCKIQPEQWFLTNLVTSWKVILMSCGKLISFFISGLYSFPNLRIRLSSIHCLSCAMLKLMRCQLFY